MGLAVGSAVEPVGSREAAAADCLHRSFRVPALVVASGWLLDFAARPGLVRSLQERRAPAVPGSAALRRKAFPTTTRPRIKRKHFPHRHGSFSFPRVGAFRSPKKRLGLMRCSRRVHPSSTKFIRNRTRCCRPRARTRTRPSGRDTLTVRGCRLAAELCGGRPQNISISAFSTAKVLAGFSHTRSQPTDQGGNHDQDVIHSGVCRCCNCVHFILPAELQPRCSGPTIGDRSLRDLMQRNCATSVRPRYALSALVLVPRIKRNI